MSRRKDQEKARDFFRDLRASELAPAYLFYGAERFLVDQAVQRVTEKLFGREEPDPFLYEALRAPDADGRRIANAARTVPMLGGQRLVVARNIDALDESHLAEIASYLEKPSKRSILVLTATKVDVRRKSWKAIRKGATTVGFEQLYRNQMPAWIHQQARRKRIQIDSRAAEHLADAVGTDMTLLDLALEKLALLVGAGETVTREHAESAVAATRERSVFELTDCLSKRDLGGSLLALRSLEEQGEQSVRINAMIARHVRLLLKTWSGLERGLSNRDLAGFAGLAPFFVKDYVRGARQFPVETLIDLHGMLFEADRLLKSSRMPGNVVLERVIAAFCLDETGLRRYS